MLGEVAWEKRLLGNGKTKGGYVPRLLVIGQGLERQMIVSGFQDTRPVGVETFTVDE